MLIAEGLYFPYRENKGADQLRSYREADLRLCFGICEKLVFSRYGSYSILFFWITVLKSNTFLQIYDAKKMCRD